VLINSGVFLSFLSISLVLLFSFVYLKCFSVLDNLGQVGHFRTKWTDRTTFYWGILLIWLFKYNTCLIFCLILFVVWLIFTIFFIWFWGLH